MDESNGSDDEIQENTLSPKLSKKKQKLNNGASQETDDTPRSEENIDSGVGIDKSESTSSEGRTTTSTTETQTTSNEEVNAGPSTSNIRAILLKFKKPKRERNYRKRRTPGQDSDSESSKDSDDLSIGDGVVTLHHTDNSDEEPQEENRLVTNMSDSDESVVSEFHMGDTCSENSTDTFFSDEIARLQSDDTDDSDTGISRDENEEEEDENNSNHNKTKRPSVLLTERPKHDYVILRELLKRELGLTFALGRTGMSDVVFQQKFNGSLHAVYRMKRLHLLNKHRGCVNAINFHPEGHLLASGSDDMNVIVWDWAANRALQTIRTGHKSNVFQSKFLYLNARSQLNIVTCARDGQVRLLQCPPSGGCGEGAARRRLAAHARAAHKLHVTAAAPHSVVSAGEDGAVIHCDVRHDTADRLFTVKDRGSTIPLYSVHGHPLDVNYLVVAGSDRFVRVYDRRKTSRPATMYCPSMFTDNVNASKKLLRISMMHLTCAIYNHDGSEILGSYNDEDIYLFDTKDDVYEKDSEKMGFKARFSGHRNTATFKGVSFFGPRSQYVVSGSDCSHIYVWHAPTQALVQWLPGDVGGVVNCIEAHPTLPVLASSGLDKDVKLWLPAADDDPTYRGMEQVVRDNSTSALRSPLFNDFLPSLYSHWRGERERAPGAQPNLDFDGNVCTAF